MLWGDRLVSLEKTETGHKTVVRFSGRWNDLIDFSAPYLSVLGIASCASLVSMTFEQDPEFHKVVRILGLPLLRGTIEETEEGSEQTSQL